MSKTRDCLIKILLKRLSGDAFTPSLIPGVDFIRFSMTTQRRRTYWSSSFVIILQGHKEITLEEFAYKYKEAHTILTPVGLPVLSRVVVEQKSKPFLAIRIAFNPLELHDVALKFPSSAKHFGELKTHGILKGPADEVLLSTVLRLLELSEDDAPILGPMIIREIYYYLLKSDNGPTLRQFVLSGSKLQVIAETVRKIRSELTDDLDIDALAKKAHMSRTAFFSAFKKVTAMSPIQLQKKLRLLEARHLLSADGQTAENAAFAVGYKSASQFSREYSRLFGHSPRKDTR